MSSPVRLVFLPVTTKAAMTNPMIVGINRIIAQPPTQFSIIGSPVLEVLLASEYAYMQSKDRAPVHTHSTVAVSMFFRQ